MTLLRYAVLSCLSAVALSALAAAQSSVNLSLQSQVPGTPCATGGVWQLGGRYVLMGRRSLGWAIVDAIDPANPVVNHIHPPGYPRTDIRSYGSAEIKSDGRYIFVSSEDYYQGNSGGVFVYDTVPNPMNPTLVLDYRPPELSGGVHNLFVANDHLYCVSSSTNKVEVYNIQNRLAPVHVSTLGNNIASVWAHDVIVIGNRAYCSMLTAGFVIYDVTNPAAPVQLAHRTYSNPFTHNAWPSKDQRYLYTTDENIVGGIGGAVRIWDISNLASITQVGTYKIGDPASIVHNVWVADDLLFVSYYKEGVRVCSLQPNPTAPVEIAHYDTFPAGQTPCFPSTNYAGCWGVLPLNRNTLITSDLDNGLFLLRLQPLTQTLTASPNPVAGGQNLAVDLTYTNSSPGVLDAAAILVATSIGGVPIESPLAIDAGTMPPGSNRSVLFSIPVPFGLPPGLVIEVTGTSALFSPHLLMLSRQSVLPITFQ